MVAATTPEAACYRPSGTHHYRRIRSCRLRRFSSSGRPRRGRLRSALCVAEYAAEKGSLFSMCQPRVGVLPASTSFSMVRWSLRSHADRYLKRCFRLETPPHVGEMARLLGLDAPELTLRFRAENGISPSGYLKAARIARADGGCPAMLVIRAGRGDGSARKDSRPARRYSGLYASYSFSARDASCRCWRSDIGQG